MVKVSGVAGSALQSVAGSDVQSVAGKAEMVRVLMLHMCCMMCCCRSGARSS